MEERCMRQVLGCTPGSQDRLNADKVHVELFLAIVVVVPHVPSLVLVATVQRHGGSNEKRAAKVFGHAV